MKRKFEHPAPSQRELNGPKYWRSLDELAQTPGFKAQLEREFPEGASEMNGVDRRHFMKIMAASFALGGIGLAGCRRPERNILPFGKSVEGIIPGLPQYYATAMPLRKSAIPLLAETHQGRPTKLEGNPTYKPHGGAASILAQASILDLYDPDRATAHTKGGAKLTNDEVNTLLADLAKKYSDNGGQGLAFLAEESSSPTRARLIRSLRQKFPQALWAEYEPIADEPPLAAAQAAFGANVKPVYRFESAKRIVSIDCDFLHAEAGSVYYARSYSNGRRVNSPKDEMNRLYVAESAMTLTGSMADHRLRAPTSHMTAFAAALAIALRVPGADALQSLASAVQFKAGWIEACAQDLRDNAADSLVVTGAHLPALAHGIAYAINAALGSIGRTVEFVTIEPSPAASIVDLANAIKSKSVSALLVLGGNPVYNAPADLDWAALQKSVAEVIRFGSHVDETSAQSGVHIAAAHYLESWGDARTVDGTIVPIQPMIMPLFGGLTEIEILARLAGEANADPYELVRTTLNGLVEGAEGDKALGRVLHDGLVANSAYAIAKVNFNARTFGALLRETPTVAKLDSKNLEVRFVADHKVDDGRFANNGWLQEVSHPITKICWDNVIMVSPKLAQAIGIYPKGSLLQVARVEEGTPNEIAGEKARIGELAVNGRKVRGPIHIQPGLAEFTVVVSLGYGRTHSGRIGTNTGFSAYTIRTTESLNVATGGTITVSDEIHLLPNTQAHWSMEGRDLVREANFEGPESYRENSKFVREIGMESESPPAVGEVGLAMTPQQRATELPRGNSLYQTPNKGNGGFDGIHQWGMVIDLNTCTGCNACVVACQSENNVPIVGRDQSLRGRQMHWIRIDRYYSDGQIDPEAFGGEHNKELPEDPQVSLQPVACVHCELAPCETVCPVNATVHDEEGINTMAYNRCIGTRYCANNCPYKVRRFNYFDWNQRQLDSLYMSQLGPKGMPELVKMVKNPDVTIRMRGVMEKCTYCVQRVEAGKIRHKVKVAQEGRPGDVAVPDGTIVPACAQTCPVNAIVFGNILDPNSEVSKWRARDQDYQLLAYLNTRPRTSYSARLRNPNPKMPDYRDLPLSRIEHTRKNEAGGGEEPAHHGAESHGEHGSEKKEARG